MQTPYPAVVRFRVRFVFDLAIERTGAHITVQGLGWGSCFGSGYAKAFPFLFSRSGEHLGAISFACFPFGLVCRFFLPFVPLLFHHGEGDKVCRYTHIP